MNPDYHTLQHFFLLGKTQKSHGTSGQLRVKIDNPLKSYIKPEAYLFLDLNGSKVPYLVKDVDDSAHFVITLEEVVNKKDSDLLSGLDIWIPVEEVKPRHMRSPKNLRDKWQEYRIEDIATGTMFAIKRVEEFPQQLMAVVQLDNKEILIPMSEQLITEIDKTNKLIRMEIPEGLLDL